MFDLRDPAGVLVEVNDCRKAYPDGYVRVLAFDARKGTETVRMSFIVQRPADEPGFDLIRAEGRGRSIGYTVRPYATENPPGRRYGRDQAG